MKNNLWIYLIGLVASIVLGRFRPGFVSTMLFYIMICLPIAELTIMGITYKYFTISHDVNKRIITKGQKVEYKLALLNPTFLVFAPIKLYYTGSELLFLGEDLQQDEMLLMYPYSREQFDKVITCRYRGNYNIGVDRVEIHGFFRFFYFEYRSIETHKILVYPTIHELKAMNFHHVLSDTSESVVSFDKIDQSIYSEIRPYQAGDSFSRIHWKLSARRDEWVTKEFEGSVNNKTKIMMNNEALPYDFQRNIIIEDYLIEGAVALTKYLLENSAPVELYWHHYETKSIKGNQPKDFSKFYEAYARLDFEHMQGSFEKLLESETANQYEKCILMIFTHKVTHSLSELILKKKRQGYEVNIITEKPFEYQDLKTVVKEDTNAIYRLMDIGVRVYFMTFEDGTCRMEVA